MGHRGPGPIGIRKVGNKLVDDDGNPAAIVRGGAAFGDLVGGLIPTPATPPSPPPPDPTVGLIWTSGYDSQAAGTTLTPAWAHVQKPNNPGLSGPIREDSMKIVAASDVPGSGYYKPTGQAMRVELRPLSATSPGSGSPADGDVNASNATNRAEVYDRYPTGSASSTPNYLWPDPVDSQRWYGWSTYIDPSFPAVTNWCDITQWKGYRTGSPPIAIEISGSSFKVGGQLASIALGGINRGGWTRFEIGFRWSNIAANGWINVWVNGVEVYPQAARATMNTYGGQPDPIYLKQGIYRSAGENQTAIVHHGPLKVGYSRADVRP